MRTDPGPSAAARATAGADPSLINADIAPTPPEGRRWSVFNMASLWIGMVVCVPTYMLAGGLVDMGMNGDELPADQGYPLRIVLPGYYGVKHPAWVTGIELVSQPIDDYYEVGGWECSPPMPVDSKIFFPASGAEVVAGVPFDVGGAAFGGTRVDKVEVTTDDGASWIEARAVRHEDLDHVWMFWKATVTLETVGEHEIHARATDIHGHAQPQDDVDPLDGTDKWPRVLVQVTEGG